MTVTELAAPPEGKEARKEWLYDLISDAGPVRADSYGGFMRELGIAGLMTVTQFKKLVNSMVHGGHNRRALSLNFAERSRSIGERNSRERILTAV